MRHTHILPLLGLVALACGSSSDDAPRPAPSGSGTFVTDAEPSGARIVLTPKSVTPTELVLELRAHEVADLYGLAARVVADPAGVSFDRVEVGPAFSNMSRTISLARPAGEPGQVVLTVSGQGQQQTSAANDVVLATLHYKRISPSSAGGVGFVGHRSGVVDSAGRRAASVSFVGGELRAK